MKRLNEQEKRVKVKQLKIQAQKQSKTESNKNKPFCEQDISSDPSLHSAFPSQTHLFGMHPNPSAQRNLSGPHPGLYEQFSSSVPSAQSRSPSHLQEDGTHFRSHSNSSDEQAVGLRERKNS